MNTRLPLLLLLMLVLGVAPRAAAADEVIWSGVVLATNGPAGTPPPALAGFEKKLRGVFGYKRFEVLAEHSQRICKGESKWLVPGKTISMRVKAEQGGDGQRVLQLQLFQKERLLVQTEARLGRGSPLFIRGPMSGDGQLIIVLLVR